MSKAQLHLSPDEMKDLGYQAVDILIEHLYKLHEKPVGNKAGRQELQKLIHTPLPRKGEAYNNVLQLVMEHVVSNVMHTDHPRFFGWVPGPSNFVSVVADFLASGFNVFSGVWLVGSGAAQVEITTLQWLVQLMRMSESAGGLFVSGGSVANLVGLTVARQVKLNNKIDQAVVYASDQTHSSNDRALKILNFTPEQIIRIPTDKYFRLDTEKLILQIEKDKKEGKRPFCVIANAGTTNTGAVDPLIAIHDICKKENLWMHVDGAYGAAAMLSKKGQKLLKGISLADSLTLDPHKWLFQPYEMGCVLIKDKRWLPQTFEMNASYLKDTLPEEEEYNFSNAGLQLTRNFRALKLWMSFKVFGVDAFSESINQGIRSASKVEKKIAQLPHWEVVTPAQLGILTFRFVPPHTSPKEIDVINTEIIEEMIRQKYAVLSSTVLYGKTVLRMCTINPRTTKDDIQNTIIKLNEVAIKLFKMKTPSFNHQNCEDSSRESCNL